MEPNMEHAVDRASYELGYEVSRRVYLKRVKDILEKERDRYDMYEPELSMGHLALTQAIAAVEALL